MNLHWPSIFVSSLCLVSSNACHGLHYKLKVLIENTFLKQPEAILFQKYYVIHFTPISNTSQYYYILVGGN